MSFRILYCFFHLFFVFVFTFRFNLTHICVFSAKLLFILRQYSIIYVIFSFLCFLPFPDFKSLSNVNFYSLYSCELYRPLNVFLLLQYAQLNNSLVIVGGAHNRCRCVLMHFVEALKQLLLNALLGNKCATSN